GVGSGRIAARRAADHRGDAFTVGARRGYSGERRQRRQDVDGADLLLDRPAGMRAAGQPHDPRDAQRRLVEEHPVLLLAVLTEALAVIGDDGDDGAVEARVAFERGDQPADAGVDVGDLAVVRRCLEARVEWRRWLVRRVRVVEVHPGEEWLRAAAVQPGERRVDHRVAAPLHLQLLAVAEAWKLRVEQVEALREAVGRAEDERAGEAAGAVT